MKRVTLAITVLLLLTFAVSAAAQQSNFSSLEELMTGREYRESGLDKLSDEELARLNEWVREWLREHGMSETSRRGATVGPSTPAEGDNEPIVTRIEGEFRGWDGDTVFRLQNGQVWRQAASDTFFIKAQDPKVTIEPGLLGSWFLSVEGYNSRVRVERVK